MRIWIVFAALVGLIGSAGCGRTPAQNNGPITEEQQRQIDEADRQVSEDESAVDRDVERKNRRRGATEEALVDR